MFPRTTESRIAAAVILGAVGVSAAYFGYFGWALTLPAGGPSSWSDFGNYFGGLVNPIVGLATIILLVRTLQATQGQLSHLQLQRKLEEIQKRLDGVLQAWNAAMEESVDGLVLPCATGGLYELTGLSVKQALYNYERISQLTEAMNGAWAPQLQKWWEERFNAEVNMLRELAQYTEAYDQAARDRSLTNYYRHRIQRALRNLNAVKAIPPEVFAELQVGIQHPPVHM